MSVDPACVPAAVLASGARMPAIGLGTFGSDNYSASQIAEAVLGAADAGYRHFDCAAVYHNEKEIGNSLSKIMKGGVRRLDLWVTGKVWNDRHNDIVSACRDSLRDLGLDYFDLYLVHWPFPNHHAPGVDGDSRDPLALPYIHSDFMRTWRQMESLVASGLARHIGTSNMTIPKLRLLLRDAKIEPAANEMEMHPHFQQRELFSYLREHGIVPIGYCPIGSPSRPDRDRTPEDTVDLEDPVIISIAGRLNVHPAAICVKWQVQRGSVPIPFSVKRHQYEATLEAVVSEPLSAQDMEAIAKIDRGCRLIKGQVFLWPEAKSWEDLWDLDGVLTE